MFVAQDDLEKRLVAARIRLHTQGVERPELLPIRMIPKAADDGRGFTAALDQRAGGVELLKGQVQKAEALRSLLDQDADQVLRRPEEQSGLAILLPASVATRRQERSCLPLQTFSGEEHLAFPHPRQGQLLQQSWQVVAGQRGARMPAAMAHPGVAQGLFRGVVEFPAVVRKPPARFVEQHGQRQQQRVAAQVAQASVLPQALGHRAVIERQAFLLRQHLTPACQDVFDLPVRQRRQLRPRPTGREPDGRLAGGPRRHDPAVAGALLRDGLDLLP